MDLTLEEIDQTRQLGLRPEVVGCFVHEKKLLMVYKAKYELWLLPQGGIDNKETWDQALSREMKEELGDTLWQQVNNIPIYLGQDAIEFSPQRHNVRDLFTDAGTKIDMIGKRYWFYAIPVKAAKIDIEESEFDDMVWLDYEAAQDKAMEIYQSGKRRVTIKAIEWLREQNLI